MSDSCDPIDYNLPGSSVHGISQARILEWVAISFSSGSSWSRGWTCISCIGREILYHWASRGSSQLILPKILLSFLELGNYLILVLVNVSYITNELGYIFLISWRLITSQHCSGFWDIFLKSFSMMKLFIPLKLQTSICKIIEESKLLLLKELFISSIILFHYS